MLIFNDLDLAASHATVRGARHVEDTHGYTAPV